MKLDPEASSFNTFYPTRGEPIIGRPWLKVTSGYLDILFPRILSKQGINPSKFASKRDSSVLLKSAQILVRAQIGWIQQKFANNDDPLTKDGQKWNGKMVISQYMAYLLTCLQKCMQYRL